MPGIELAAATWIALPAVALLVLASLARVPWLVQIFILSITGAAGMLLAADSGSGDVRDALEEHYHVSTEGPLNVFTNDEQAATVTQDGRASVGVSTVTGGRVVLHGEPDTEWPTPQS